ncbi:MAG TPA: hypothetical protein VF183_10235, partial [Acidimicrobiales bacterium]
PNDQTSWARRINELRRSPTKADQMDMKTLQRNTIIDVDAAPAAPFIPVVEDRLAAIHRRAAIAAAILRDERLEIAIDENGNVTARRVRGATPAITSARAGRCLRGAPTR